FTTLCNADVTTRNGPSRQPDLPAITPVRHHPQNFASAVMNPMEPVSNDTCPMLVNCIAYGHGKGRSIALDDISEVIKDPEIFIWVGLYEPDEELLEKLAQEFGLHELAGEDAHKAH